MMVVNLKGGLGNQLFQYAYARKIALANKAEFKLDISSFPHDTQRHYSLSPFNIIENFATPEEIAKLKYPYGIFSKVWRRFKFKILRLTYVGYSPSCLKAKDNSYLDGYWQSYKYFEDIIDTIYRDFSLKQPLQDIYLELVKKISDTESVSLHIRRGDYINNPKVQKNFGSCSLEYYFSAVKLISTKVSNPVFYIFSDDINWVKENLKIDRPVVYVSDGQIKDYEELILMSKCRHNIIANSSFSWWGAMLNQNKNKIVISPSIWFADNSVKIDDIIPSSWIKI